MIFVESSAPEDRYSRILVTLGVLTDTEAAMVDEALAGLVTTEEAALITAGVLTTEQVREHAPRLTSERACGSFREARPVWTFSEETRPEDMPAYPVSSLATIARAVRELYTPERLRLELPVTGADRYAFDSAALGRIPLPLLPEEAAVASALDGARTWEEAVAASRVHPDRAHAALFLLSTLGLAAYGGLNRGNAPASPTPVFASVPGATGSFPAATARAGSAPGRADEMLARASRELPEVLDLPPEAEIPAVEQAFRAIVGRYDLGRAHQLPERERDAALALLDRAADALLVMTHPDTREEYFAAAPWDREGAAAKMAIALTAEKNYVKAGVFLAAGNFLAAEAAMLPALHLEPRDARFHLRMGKAIFLRAKQRGGKIPAGATRALEKAAAFDERNFEAWLYLGHVAFQEGERAKARALYERALALNPSSEEAQRGIMRTENG